MANRTLARLFRLFAILAILLVTIHTGFAAKKQVPNRSVTDAAGRNHVRPAGRISDTQRKNAARIRKNLRSHTTRPTRKIGGQR
jgi:hypothetical protein